MTYEEAKAYIRERGKLGSVLGLSTMKGLMDNLGNPQDDLPFVHIAGTNGKGSTTAMLSSILEESGYKAGCYNSPAVFDAREQIRVNGRWISEEEMARGIAAVKEAADRMEQDGGPGPTSFEVETALAFWYFKDQECDIAIVEAGLGGDMDATNIITSTVLSIITSLSYDHMKILGDTLEEIAGHKAGIIKPMVPAVLYTFEETPDRQRAWETVRQVCREKKSCLYTTEPYEVLERGLKDGRQLFHYRNYWNLELSMAGRYQIYNACTAIEAADELKRQGYRITEQTLREGLKKACWPGRFEWISHGPDIVIDGAHNPGGAAQLAQSITYYFTNRRILYIMGVLGDKDFCDVIRMTHGSADLIYTVTPDNPRALPAEELKRAVCEFHDPDKVKACQSVEEALSQALGQAGKEDVILAFGSLSYLGELKALIGQQGFVG